MNVKRSIILLLVSIFINAQSSSVFSQLRLVELTGQVFFKDSDEPVGDVEVRVEGTERKTYTNDQGNFSIVVKPDEKLIFEGIGLVSSSYHLPANFDKNYEVIRQFISIDTAYYQEIVITKYLSKEEFDFLMKYGYIPDENLLASRRNMSEQAKNSFIQRSPLAYYENQLMLQQNIHNRHGSYYGQQPTVGINPFAWHDLFKNWKRNTQRNKE